MKITKLHGAGGTVMQQLIKDLILNNIELKSAGSLSLDDLDDSSTIKIFDNEIALTTDSYTVNPIFFKGGDIGRLAVSGTVNDLAVVGAKPLALTLSFILPEGFEYEKLERIVKSINETSKEAEVPIITGDTKVSDSVNDIVINTSGVGIVKKLLKDSNVKEGDAIIISGNIAEHGLAILLEREGFEFETNIKSDVSPLNKMIEEILDLDIHAMKDPTRGGVANALNELAEKSNIGIVIEEDKLPISEEVKGLCEILGLDPLTIANEGKVIIAVNRDDAEECLRRLRKTKYGKNAEIVGYATKEHKGVLLDTGIGKRIIDSPIGDPIPRVC
ncbi:hydrogenase expression/formation protein HypE [Methanocaldococcus indicus]|uniref:hydrogenase expression/formation protein HypE n=1 Tax=Methanocaldococcus indicus TaxID=213231 RepID=UPI003C6CC765